MLDIKLIREHPDVVEKDLKKRNESDKIKLLKKLIEDDKERRDLLKKVEDLRRERNELNEEISTVCVCVFVATPINPVNTSTVSVVVLVVVIGGSTVCKWSIVPPVPPNTFPVPASASPNGKRCLRFGKLNVVEPSPTP